jgi:signal transduction histidine kinase
VERAMENAALAERLLRAEKLAGLGLLAGGMAHALNNPLTAVLGFAELIADTTGEGRVKEDAEIIVREALRMRQTVETLLEFSRPPARGEEPVDVVELVRGLGGACAEKLESRGVRLVIQAGEETVGVRGDRDRLRLMLEHLLNNAAQALAGVASGEERVIRVSVGQDGVMVHLIVSDTGPGFREPGRVFELGDSVRGAGLGLSVCYAIAHEYGGEISAFNLHPHGAAVAVELPGADFAIKKSGVGSREQVVA